MARTVAIRRALECGGKVSSHVKGLVAVAPGTNFVPFSPVPIVYRGLSLVVYPLS